MLLHYHRYSLKSGLQKVKTKTAIIIATVGLVVGSGGGLALASFGTAHAVTNYTSFGSAVQQTNGVNLTSNNGTDFSGITLTLPSGTTVNDLTDIEANFQLLSGSCYGGSPRFSVETPAGNIFLYMGDQPSFTSCAGGPTGNLLNTVGSQIDSSQLSGGSYGDSWSHVQSLAGSQPVTELDIVVDGGWHTPQSFLFTSALVNTTNYNFVPSVLLGSATGGLTLTNPRQQISFNAFDYGSPANDYGTVEYQNFNYPGGLHYTAAVQCVNVKDNMATFMFQIPGGFPGLSGLYIVSQVTDNGSPAKSHDTYGHTATADRATALSWCENGAPITNYTITGGNLVVHKH